MSVSEQIFEKFHAHKARYGESPEKLYIGLDFFMKLLEEVGHGRNPFESDVPARFMGMKIIHVYDPQDYIGVGP